MIGIFATILFFLFPGSLLLWNKNFFRSLPGIEKVPLFISISLSYWIIGFWWLTYIPIPLNVFIYLSLITSIVGFFVYAYKKRRTLRFTQNGLIKNGLLVLWFLIVAIPGVYILFHNIAPNGQDMSMHAYLAKVIYLRNGFPTTLAPLVPLNQFGLYPIGFPTLIASMMILNKVPVYTNALWLVVFTYWFYSASLYTLARTRFSFLQSAIVTVCITWVSLTPNDIIEWGANPTVLSLAFLIITCIYFLTRNEIQSPVFVVIAFYTAFLIHYMLPIGFVYIVLFLLPILWPKFRLWVNVPRKRIKIILYCLILLLPSVTYFLTHPFSLSEKARQVVVGYHHQELMEWAGTIRPTPIFGTTQFIAHVFGIPFFTLLLISFVIVIVTYRKRALPYLTYVIGIYILIINSQYWILPLSSILYPKRISLLLIIPAVFIIATALSSLVNWMYKHFVSKSLIKPNILYSLTIVVLTIYFFPVMQNNFRRFTSSKLCVITREDLRALDWLTRHTTPYDRIFNNYNDAGIWIPAIANRQITLYHTNPIDMDHILLNTKKASYAYIGNKSLIAANDTVQQDIALHPDMYTLVYINHGVKIYKISY